MTITGTIRGYWGFDSFEGPTITIQQIDGKNWKIVNNTQLLAGQDNHLTLKGDGSACVQHIALASDKEKDVDVPFKPASGNDAKDTLALDVSLKTVQPGGYSLTIQQYGDSDRDKVPLTAYTAGIHLDSIKIHSGDNIAVLTGESLKNVASVKIGEQTFTPTGEGDDKTIHLHANAGVSPDDGSDATVKLKDGRTMTATISAEAARPGLKLLSLKATPAQKDGALPVILGAKDDIPLDGKLTFVVQTKDVFPRTQTIEVATTDGSVRTSLSRNEQPRPSGRPHCRCHAGPVEGVRSIRFWQIANASGCGRRYVRGLDTTWHPRPRTGDHSHPLHQRRRSYLHCRRQQFVPRAILRRSRGLRQGSRRTRRLCRKQFHRTDAGRRSNAVSQTSR